MIYPYTFFFHFVMAVLCFFVLLYMIISHRNLFNSISLKGYFNWFLFYFLYNIFLVFPLLLFKNLQTIGIVFFYNIALLFQSIAMWHVFKVSLFFFKIKENKIRIISKLFLAGVLLTTSLYFIYPSSPFGSDDGNFVFWNSNKIVVLIYSFFAFLTGYSFGLSVISNFSLIKDTILRIKAVLIAMSAFIIPFAAPFYFGTTNIIHIYLAFSLAILGLFLLVLATVIMKIFRPYI